MTTGIVRAALKLSLCFCLWLLLHPPLGNAAVETGWPTGKANECRNASDFFINFEQGIEGAEVKSTNPDVEFTNTAGLNWQYLDFRTGNYNTMYVMNGNMTTWLGTSGSRGRITFKGGSASYLSLLTKTYSGLTIDAFDSDGNFLATSGWAGSNLYTGTMTRLTVEADGIAYVEIHDSGNYWTVDDICADAKPVCQPVPGHTNGSTSDRINLVFVPDSDYNGDMKQFLTDVNNNISQRLDSNSVPEIRNNLDKFNFFYTTRTGSVTASSGVGESALPDKLLSQCTFANAVVVLHKAEFGDSTTSVGNVGVFSAEGTVGRSFIHEGGHGIFVLRDEYDAQDGDPNATCYTNYSGGIPPLNIWDTQAACQADAKDQGWDANGCYMFTSCQGDWWKLGDAALKDDAARYADATHRYIMYDGTYFSNGFGPAATRRINTVFSNIGSGAGGGGGTSEKSIVLHFHISDSGLSLLESSFVISPSPAYLPGDYPYAAKLFTAGGNLVGTYGFNDPRLVFAESGYAGPTSFPSSNFTVTLPYYKSIERADVVDNQTGAVILTANLSQYASHYNTPPVADAGADQEIVATSGGNVEVTLNGSHSADSDSTPGTNDDIVEYSWYENASLLAQGNPVHVSLGVGSHDIRLVVKDKSGATGEDTVTVKVTAPVACSIGGSAYNFPESATYRATYTISATGPANPAGSIKYSYTKTRMTFSSTSISAMSLSGDTYTVSGTGTVNGVPGYTFVTSFTDASPDILGMEIRKVDGSIYFKALPKGVAGGDIVVTNK